MDMMDAREMNARIKTSLLCWQLQLMLRWGSDGGPYESVLSVAVRVTVVDLEVLRCERGDIAVEGDAVAMSGNVQYETNSRTRLSLVRENHGEMRSIRSRRPPRTGAGSLPHRWHIIRVASRCPVATTGAFQ